MTPLPDKKFERKESFKKAVFVVLLLIIGYLIISIGLIICDVHDPFNVNPPDQVHLKQISLDYPSLGPTNLITSVNGISTNPPLLHIDVFLQYTGILAEGTLVDVAATGTISPKGQETIARGGRIYGDPPNNDYNVLLTFNGASRYNQSNPNCKSPELLIPIKLEGYPDPRAYRCYNLSALDPSDIKMIITWDTQGDYSPFVVVYDRNVTPITTEYPFSKIHVSGSDIVLQEKYSKIIVRLTIALLLFTIIAILPILFEVTPKTVLTWLGIEDKKSNGENNHPNNPQQTESPNKQPSPQIPKKTKANRRSKRKHRHR